MDKRRLQLTIDSRLANVSLLAEAVRSSCIAGGMSAPAASEVELSVVEAVNNCIEHAYRMADNGQVVVALEIGAGDLQIQISDRGRSMPRGMLAAAAPPTFDPADTQSLPEGGMGLGIVKQLMNDVRYHSTAGTNVLTMRRRF